MHGRPSLLPALSLTTTHKFFPVSKRKRGQIGKKKEKEEIFFRSLKFLRRKLPIGRCYIPRTGSSSVADYGLEGEGMTSKTAFWPEFGSSLTLDPLTLHTFVLQLEHQTRPCKLFGNEWAAPRWVRILKKRIVREKALFWGDFDGG